MNSFKLNFEYLFLAVFVIVFLLVGVGGIFGNKLSHDLPTGYFASDSFFHQTETQYMKEQGRVYYAQPSIVGNQKVIDIHPPMVYQLVAPFSKVSGLEVYDAIYFLSILFVLLSALVMYFIIRRYSKYVAMLSLPITVLVFTSPFSQMVHLGQWLFIPGAMFMFASFWALFIIKEKWMFAVFAFFVAATALAHQPELIFLVMFMVVYLAVLFVRAKFSIKETGKTFIPLAIAGVISLALSIYSLIIFLKSWIAEGHTEGLFKFTMDNQMTSRGFADITPANLGWIAGLVILAGVIFFIITKKRENYEAASISAFMVLFIGIFLTYFGFGKRSFAHKWLWHIYLAFFFGLGVYHIVKFVIKKWNSALAAGVAAVILIALAAPLYNDVRGSIMDPYNWEALKWVKQNTPENATINYFYIGYLEQSPTTYNSQRIARMVVYPDYFTGLKNSYKFGLAYAYDQYICKLGFMKFGYYKYLEKNETEKCEPKYPGLLQGEVQKETNLCDIEYYYFNSFGSVEGAAQLNMAIRQQLLQNSWIKEVYSNAGVSILKNDELGRACNVG